MLIEDDKIITLLSNSRDPEKPHRPATLSKYRIAKFIQASTSPNRNPSALTEDIAKSLQMLEAKGEILAGKRSCFCVAPPTLIAISKGNITGLIFRGDRAYLSLAHNLLGTNQNSDEVRINPMIRKFERIQKKLLSSEIRLLTAEDLTHYLPTPQDIPKYLLRCPADFPDVIDGQFFIYNPISYTTQESRWQTLIVHHKSDLADRSLIKLSRKGYCYQNDQYFYLKGNEIYELDKETAILAMFHRDLENNAPLMVSWDSFKGKLDLRDVYLPPSYLKCLWQLCRETETYRVYSVYPSSKPLVESALRKLGCQLI
jgi:hypothetical protein